MQRKKRQLLIAVILLLVVGGAYALWRNSLGQVRQSAGKAALMPQLADVQRADLGLWSAALWKGEHPNTPASLQTPVLVLYVAAREDGGKQADVWSDEPILSDAMAEAITQLRAQLGDRVADTTTLEVFVALQSERIEESSQRERLLSNIHRGIVGIEEVGTLTKVRRHSPTQVMASNRKHEKLLGMERGATNESVSGYRFLLGTQLLVDVDTGATGLMERGNTYVPLSAVERAGVTTFADGMAQWMWNSLHQDGRMTYLYWPSQGREAPGRDNLIRQFMATIALGRLAATHNDGELWRKSAANIDYNLAKYYRQEEEFGVVELRGKVKLGAMALAALAIVEHKERPRWRVEELALRQTIDSLWHEDGSFQTFYRPSDRNDNQNFYPGEALLLWATLYAQNHDEELLTRIMKSVAYYQSWHLDSSVPRRRNPAFIPWHTQAYFLVWQQTHNTQLRDFIFEMNDWLLAVQQWKGVRYKDTKGRFYAPGRRFGPPHASATGVYLESLIDAYALAKAVNDDVRKEKYSEAIRRGLRSSMQLQFRDDIDMFYVRKKDRVRGGLRTTVYDNQIRCDNVQHTLMGTLKILDSDLLTSE